MRVASQIEDGIMQKGLVSVVLPIYNVEKYLDRCMNSVVNQTYGNLEIIMVDDGSPDNCPRLCDEWAAKDARVKVVHKKNAGLGMARNTGIENATGEYICFFDSDDYIAPETIAYCVSAAQEEKADIVCFGLRNVDSDGNVVTVLAPNTEKSVYRGEEILSEFLPEMVAADPDKDRKTNLCMSAWAAMYSMEVIRGSGWRFVSEREIISEDVYSLLSFYRHVNCAVVVSKSLYYYCANGVSLTHMYRPDRFERIKHFYKESVKLSRELGYAEEVERRLARLFLSFSIAAMKQVAVAEGHSLKERFAGVKAVASDELFVNAAKLESRHDSLARKVLFLACRFRLTWMCFIIASLKG